MSIIPTLNAIGVGINNLKAAQAGAAFSAEALAAVFSILTPAQIANNLAIKQLTTDQLFAVLASSDLALAKQAEIVAYYVSATATEANAAATRDLIKAKLEELLTSHKITQEQKAEIMAHFEATVAKTADGGATKALTIDMGALTAAVWANIKAMGIWLATNPVGWLIMLAAALAATTWAIDAFTVSAEEQAEKFRDLQSAYQETASEITSIGSELKQVQDRMKELMKLADSGSITPSQTEELNQLREVNFELERELAILEKLAKEQQRQTEQAAVDTYEATTYRSVVEPTKRVDYQGDTIEVPVKISGIEAMEELLAAMDALQQKRDQTLLSFNSETSSAEEYAKQLGELDDLLAEYETEAARIAKSLNEQENGIAGVTDEGAALKTRISEVLDAWLAWDDNVPDILSNTQDGLDDVSDSVDELADSIKTFSEASDQLEKLYSVLKTLNDLGGDALPINVMTELLELIPEAAGEITSVADAQRLLNEKIAESEDVARSAYAQMILSNEDWLERTINASSSLQKTLADYYGTDLNNFRQLAGAKWEIEKALVSNLADLWSKYENRTLESLEQQLYYLNYQAPDPNLDQIRELQAIIDLRKAAAGQLDDLVDYTPASGKSSSSKSNNTTDYWKKEFENRYAAMKHELGMERITLEEFYAWLDGQDGYKKYFAGNAKYLAEFRQYEEEVFNGLRDLERKRLDLLDDEIAALERQSNAEGAIIAKYREKQALLKKLQEQLAAYLRTAGMSDAEIASNEQMREYVNLWYEAGDAIGEIITDIESELADSMSQLLDLTREMVKQEGEDLVDALEEQADAYAKIIARRKELLQLSQREKKYQDEVADKSKEISKLQARIDALSLDDSREAAIEKGPYRSSWSSFRMTWRTPSRSTLLPPQRTRWTRNWMTGNPSKTRRSKRSRISWTTTRS